MAHEHYGTVALFVKEAAIMTVNGGSYTSDINDAVGIKNGATGSISITAGTFSTDPSAFVAEDYEAVQSGNVWTVRAMPMVAEVGGVQYTSLQKALDVGGEVKLLQAVALTESLSIASDKTVTLDLNGFALDSSAGDGIVVEGTLTFMDSGNGDGMTQTSATSDDAIWVKAGGTLNVVSGKITSNGRYGVLYISGSLNITGGTILAEDDDFQAITLNRTAEASVTGGTITGNSAIALFDQSKLTFGGTAVAKAVDSAISTNGSKDGPNFSNDATITISGGTITSTENEAVYAPSATWTISGGTLTGNTAVYAKGGKLTITGGDFISTGEHVDFVHKGSGALDTGDTIVIESSGYPYSPAVVSISGGTFTAQKENTKAVATYSYNGLPEAEKFISGGTFSNEIEKAYLAEGKDCTGSGSTWVVADHVHSFYDNAPRWKWKVVNKEWSVTATFTCACGDTKVERAEVVMTEDNANYTYTATLTKPDGTPVTDSKTYVKTFTVTLDGVTVGNTYIYGEACTLTGAESGKLYDWKVGGVLVASGTNKYVFPVTGNVNVTSEESYATEMQPILNVAMTTSVSGTAGQAVVKANWTLPSTASIQSISIYRAGSGSDLSSRADLADLIKTYGTKDSVDLFVRSGDYTYTITGLTPNRYQNVLVEIVLKDGTTLSKALSQQVVAMS